VSFVSQQKQSPQQTGHIDASTLEAVKKYASSLNTISLERIRDEFSRIILSPNAAFGVELLRTTGLLKYIIPELEEGVGVGQNLHHIYTVWEHNLRALETCPSRNCTSDSPRFFMMSASRAPNKATDIDPPFTIMTMLGSRMTKIILARLRYPKDIVEKPTLLVDNHLFYYNVGEVTEASVRRLIKKVGLRKYA
jgi:tRNA nucleotidyltransferase (CCA-adding enzyme)